MSARTQAARSWIRWHLPVSYGTAVHVQNDRLDARVDALFVAMGDACEAAGMHAEAEECRAAGGKREPGRPVLSVLKGGQS